MNRIGMKAAAILFLACLCPVLWAAPAHAQEEAYAPIAFNEEEQAQAQNIIDSKKNRFTPVETGSVYRTRPVYTGEEYAPGLLSRTMLDNGLKAINYVRLIAGLPEVTAPDDLAKETQYGPLVMMATGEYEHNPKNTVNMPDDIFQRGAAITEKSNIGSGYTSDVLLSLYRFNLECSNDSDSSNVDCVGHRRWLLSPNMSKVGMGKVGKYVATYVFDESHQPALKPDYIAWPPNGVFPLDQELLVDPLAWSFTIQNEWSRPKYRILDPKAISVELTRRNDKKTWKFSSRSKTSATGYFHVDTQAFGYGPSVIFRPKGVTYRSGDAFTVTVHNLYNTSTGSNESVTYSVKFFSLNNIPVKSKSKP